MITKNFDLQPHLEDNRVALRPLDPNDFEALYEVASDPLIWEQHPNKDRYRREIFEIFFKGAIESGGALLAFDKESKKAIGSSRYYEADPEKKSVAIGYSFLGRQYWGHTYNKSMKTLMLNHAFKFVTEVIFHIGENNIRSQKAIEKMGAKYAGTVEMQYYGEEKVNRNFIYRINTNDWRTGGS